MSFELDPIFIAYGSLILLAALPVYIGSKLSVENDTAEADRLTGSDAQWFPILGSACLLSMYLVFKYLPKEYINYLLTAYFALFGAGAVTRLTVRFVQCFVPKSIEMCHAIRFQAHHQDGKVLFDFHLTWLNTLSMLLSCCFTAYYVMTKHWIASNVFGVAFATSAVSMIHLDSFLTGMTLLAGLFVYDIFWVFGTDVMVTVAKNFDIPVKLLFPRNILEDATGNFTLLGLGDIVIPGVFIALCLKFDKKQNTNSYFAAGLVAYVAGLLTTMAVMHTFKAAQPALLYLSPACILSALSVALVKGQLPALFAFSTETKQSVEPAKRASPRKNKSE